MLTATNEPLGRAFQSGTMAVGAIQLYFQLLQGRDGKPVYISGTFTIKAESYYKQRSTNIVIRNI